GYRAQPLADRQGPAEGRSRRRNLCVLPYTAQCLARAGTLEPAYGGGLVPDVCQHDDAGNTGPADWQLPPLPVLPRRDPRPVLGAAGGTGGLGPGDHRTVDRTDRARY